jgi:hypothetical protein
MPGDGGLNMSALTLTSTEDASVGLRRWWATEAKRCGADWGSLLTLHFEISDLLRRASSSWGLS